MFKKRKRRENKETFRISDSELNSDNNDIILSKKQSKSDKKLLYKRIESKKQLDTYDIKENMKLKKENDLEIEKELKKIKMPFKPSQYIKVSTRFDYQPDICKDYKETGYCGYGDSCKFIHDRTDYKTGWQLEQEWEDEKESAKHTDKTSTESKTEVFDVEVKCFLCEKEHSNPIVEVNCGHRFCKRCALNRYFEKKETTCAVCDKETKGIFNIVRSKQH